MEKSDASIPFTPWCVCRTDGRNGKIRPVRPENQPGSCQRGCIPSAHGGKAHRPTDFFWTD